MALMKKTNKRKIRIKLSRLKTTKNGLLLSKELDHLKSHENMLASNQKTSVEVSSTKHQAQNHLEEVSKIVHPPINLSSNCQNTKLSKVVLPHTSAVIKQEKGQTKSNYIEIIDLCSSEDDD